MNTLDFITVSNSKNDIETYEKQKFEILGLKVALISLQYLGKLLWTSDSYTYVNHGIKHGFYTEGPVASDFKLLFSQAADTTNSLATALLGGLYEETKLSRSNSEIVNYDPQIHELRMCCWEFCFLCLLEAKILSSDQVNKICIIAHDYKEKGVKKISMADALLDPSHNYKWDSSTPPEPGDILLLMQPGQLKPWHAMVSIGNGEYTDLVFYNKPHSVRRGSLQDWKNQIIWRIPLQEIPRNVEKFIAAHADLLKSYQPLPLAKLEYRLRKSQRSPENLIKLAAYLDILSLLQTG